MEIVKITNISDSQIFQQTDGYADIPVAGTFIPDPADPTADGNGYPGKSVWCCLTREDDSTFVILPTRIPLQENGTFCGILPHVPAGGMYTLACQLGGDRFHGDWERRGECRFHLGVGEVFLIAGQSNAAGYGKTPGYDPVDPAVHLYRNNGTWHIAAHPLNDSTDSLHPENAEWATPGSSPWIRFASAMHRALHCPIGLLQASKGDTFLYQWSPPDFPDCPPEENEVTTYPDRHSLWYLALDTVRRAGGKIAGVLWYQGCNDADRDCWTDVYARRFDHFVTRFREELSAPDLPFYTVQLNKSLSESPSDTAVMHRWATIRESQRTAPRRLPHVYVTPSHDLPMSDRIHNNTVANVVLGDRLAWLALESEYRKSYFGKAPDLQTASLHRESGVLTLTFTDVYAYLADLNHPYPPVTVHTPAGDLSPISRFGASGSTLTLRLDPAGTAGLTDPVTVSFADSPFGHPALPIDRVTGLPPLGFYRVPVELN
ncbi:MAG: hypothetical protein IJX14_04310 [Clostridia bacterium]|nr:hypothetical protein [Clostridia bacterium]